MAHSVATNHQFVLVTENGVNPIYSAQHRGRVESRKKKEEEKDSGLSFRILTKAEWYAECDEEVEIEFIPKHSPEKDENGKYIVKKTMLRKSEIGSCNDPRMDVYWCM